MICAAEIFEFVDIIVSLFDALKSNPYIEFNEFDSFAPKRSDAICKWYIDAEVSSLLLLSPLLFFRPISRTFTGHL